MQDVYNKQHKCFEEQRVKKGEDTLFLSFSQRVFLGFYWGFTGKRNKVKVFIKLLKSQKILSQGVLSTYKKQKLHIG